MPTSYERRDATRFPVRGIEARLRRADDTVNTLTVDDISLTGCRLSRPNQPGLQGGDPVRVSLGPASEDPHFSEITRQGRLVGVPAGSSTASRPHLGIAFESPLDQAQIGLLKDRYAQPVGLASRPRATAHVRELALNDLEALHDKEQSLKDCQFRLSLTAITILMIPGLNGVLAVFAAFSQGRGNGESYVLPPYFFDVTFLAQALLTLVSVLLLWIFSYKSDEIRRGGALIVLLQRYLVEDRFPPSYRGCQDVIENINYARDAGLAKDYEPNYRVPGVSRRYSNSRFALFGSLTLSFIPVASFLITLFCVLKENIDLQIFRMGELTWFHTALMIAVIIYQVAKKWKHDSGYRTVHYYVALFENFFEYSPPYNPRRSGPLPYGASNAAAGEMTAHP